MNQAHICIIKRDGKRENFSDSKISNAIGKAFKATGIETVEVHLSDINSREEFRKHSYVSLAAAKTICGKGFDGYVEAIEYFCG